MTAPFCQASECKQGARRPAAVAQGAPALEQPVRLDLRIVEVAKHALQCLETTKDAFAIGDLVEGRCHVDQVAQLLGNDPQLVETLWPGAVVNARGNAHDSPAQDPGSSGDYLHKRTCGVGGRRLGRCRLLEKRLPVRDQPSVAIAVERLDEPMVLLLLRVTERGRQRCQIVDRQIRRMLPKGEDEDIHVARRAGETPQPGKLGREMLHCRSRKDLS